MSSKQDTIAKIYYDRSGYGSRQTTLRDARENDPSIKKKILNNSFEKNVEIKKKPRGENSFVAPSNNQTYQIDLFFMGYYDFDADQKFRAGLVCIDVLSKFAAVIPIKSKDGPDVLEGTRQHWKKWVSALT